MGRDARVSVFPQPYAGWNDEYTRRHKRKLIRQIMDQIDQLVSEGRMVYVSCLYNETFRAIVAGCYLARHGQTGRAALDVLQACRAAGPDGWKREPASFAARRYIRAWPAGL